MDEQQVEIYLENRGIQTGVEPPFGFIEFTPENSEFVTIENNEKDSTIDGDGDGDDANLSQNPDDLVSTMNSAEESTGTTPKK